MGLTKDYSRRSAWYVNANGHRITDLGTNALTRCAGYNTIQFELREGDGNGGVPSGMPSERAELQAGRVGGWGVMQWWRWVEWFPATFPVPVNAGWGIIGGPGQFHHSAGGGQPPLAWEVRGSKRALRVTHYETKEWVHEEPLARGMEVEWRMGVLWHTDPAKGRLILVRNDVKVLDRTMSTAWSGNDVPYPKAGCYRDASVNADWLVKSGGIQVFDTDPGPFTPTPTPEPEPEPEPEPTVTMWVGADGDYQTARDRTIAARNRAKAIAANYPNPKLKDAILSVAGASQLALDALERFQAEER